MTIKTLLPFAAAALSLAGCTTVPPIEPSEIGSATLVRTDGIPTGSVRLLGYADRLTLAVGVTGMSAGTHGIHLHTTGKCEAPGFTSAGGHLNPAGKAHGTLAQGGGHLGDLPNLVVPDSGTATALIDVTGAPAAALDDIFDGDGTAVVIHAGPDDYRTDPSGNSGARIACGVLKKA